MLENWLKWDCKKIKLHDFLFYVGLYGTSTTMCFSRRKDFFFFRRLFSRVLSPYLVISATYGGAGFRRLWVQVFRDGHWGYFQPIGMTYSNSIRDTLNVFSFYELRFVSVIFTWYDFFLCENFTDLLIIINIGTKRFKSNKNYK
jgi:hypothetical protein